MTWHPAQPQRRRVARVDLVRAWRSSLPRFACGGAHYPAARRNPRRRPLQSSRDARIAVGTLAAQGINGGRGRCPGRPLGSFSSLWRKQYRLPVRKIPNCRGHLFGRNKTYSSMNIKQHEIHIKNIFESTLPRRARERIIYLSVASNVDFEASRSTQGCYDDTIYQHGRECG